MPFRRDRDEVLDIVRVSADHPDALRLIEEVQAEYVERYGGRDNTPLDIEEFAPPGGAFYIGYLDGAAVASGAWRRRGDVDFRGTSACAEIKRMYVAPRARGRGLARQMLAHLEVAATSAGAAAMILETGTAQPEAIALYESSGYVAMKPFGHYAWSESNRCFGRMLT